MSSEEGEATALLRSRVVIYGRIMLTIMVFCIGVVVCAELAYDMPRRWLSRPGGQAHLAATLGIGAALLVLQKKTLSLRALQTVDIAITLILALQQAHTILSEIPASFAKFKGEYWSPDHSQELKCLLLIAHLLLLRAAVVPSRPLRTAVIGALTVAPACIATLIVYRNVTMAADYRTVPLVTALFFGSCSIAVSTACSSIIYGLRRQVHDAMRLGHYTLDQKIGQGGMGVVYRANHVLLRRPTAVKVLRAEQLGNATLERFEREVQLTAKLSHPNIVSVYDFGRANDGTFYYAMEYLDGVDLQGLVESDGPQPPGRVRSILRQACLALAEAHAVRLIHRDIKLANMILTRRASEVDVMKLVDFGLVKESEDASATTLDDPRGLRGTPLYMSPEAILTPASVGPRSDLYALGAVGYFLLTGTPVFEGQTTFAVLGKHALSAPIPPSKLASRVPPKLERVIMRCLEKSPELRYDGAEALCRALDECDDVEPWTPESALAWWQGQRRSEPRVSSASPPRTMLTVDLQTRAAG